MNSRNTTAQPSLQFDVLIVGSGLAGLSSALLLPTSKKIAIITKRAVTEGSSGWAQGGMAAVWNKNDTFDAHVQDTFVAGAGLCDPAATRFVVENAPKGIAWLQTMGVPFSQEDGALHLTREGGHSARRIVHVTDATGAAVQRTLIDAVQKAPNITLFEQHTLVDLITTDKLGLPGSRCVGLYALDSDTDEVLTFQAPQTILATGGAGKVYLYTTNPDTATGDGIAAAWRAGCRVENMEFIQFHPTCLYHPHAKSFLISEAVRGEGGRLLLPDGTRFMEQHDPRLELAPRDVVARAIDAEIKRFGLDYVHLDISHMPPEFVREHFPTIDEKLSGLGIDMTTQPIPVVPAQHYTCGGVVVDLDARTDLPGLWAAGECTESGLHGANRLASNSLLECFVFGEAAAKDILARWDKLEEPPAIREWDDTQVTDSDEEVVIKQNWTEIRRFMWNYVGIVRTTKRLERAQNRIAMLKQEIEDYYGAFRVTTDLIELRNLLQAAELIVKSALKRHESRGLHFTLDYPETDPIARDTVLVP